VSGTEGPAAMTGAVTGSATGGAAVVTTLAAHGVEAVFGIPGTHNLAVYEGLASHPEITHILARHEQGSGFMADGYARASGRFGVCLSTTGPAALNVLTPLGTAFADSVPLLSIASEIPARGLGLGKGFLHECADQLGCYTPVTKFSARVSEVESIAPALCSAIAEITSGRPRPAAIDIPCDILDAEGVIGEVVPVESDAAGCDAGSIERVAEVLASARRPLIWAGGGVVRSGGFAALARLAERLDAPVFSTVLGKGALSADHPLSAGEALLHPAAADIRTRCDVMLAVGTGFGQLETVNWQLPMPPTLIQVDVDPEAIGRNYPVEHAIVGDAGVVLEALAEAVPERQPQVAGEVSAMRAEVRRQCRERSAQVVDLIDAVRAGTSRETVFVNDLTVAVYWARYLLDVYQPRSYLYPWNFCTLGYALAASIGAAVARPDCPVVALVGDGGMLFNVQELATAVQHRVPLTVVVFNDDAYGVLKPQQQDRYGRTFATDLVNPDFVKLAESFGAEGVRVSTPEELGSTLAQVVENDRVTVIDVPVSLPWPVWKGQEAVVANGSDAR
jgi:thiamine pyrophosphate-dependent acetolactate synthase large subunit-like protein